jgi:hypothetical protein
MAVTITADVGSASANSFATLAELTTYMEARLNSTTFDAATTDNKNRALVEATREISSLGWLGSRATDTQALSWPRWNVTNPDSPNGSLYDSSVVPQRVKDATMELANQFLVAGSTDLAALPSTDGVITKTVDVLSTTYAQPYERAKGLRRFPRVWRYIAPLVASYGVSVPLVRG